MKKAFIILLLLQNVFLFSNGQEIPVSIEQQLENQTDADQAETEDDSYFQELEQFRKHPINLNSADAEELKQLRIITDLQIENFIAYRNLLGNLISIYELQSVPAWDVTTIHKLIPFITVSTGSLSNEEMGKRFSAGEHNFLLRLSQVLEKSKGFDNTATGTKYLGSSQHLLFRYGYNYKNLLQYGLTGDKDAGEQFFKGPQRSGFDFYSFHLFARKMGIIQSLALGDFTVNMGQGLIQWQSLAFKKSVEVMGVKRQSSILRPYSSAGEFNFHRGAGITIKKGHIEATAFFSVRRLSANFVADTVSKEEFISSFLNSGYHRTNSENDDRNNLTQTTTGGNITYHGKRWHAGINSIFYNFSLPVQKRDEPYNLYAISGKSWHNLSMDYSYTFKNIHFFGEAATDKNRHKAVVNGLLISADPGVDISLVYRHIDAAYQSLNGNAFTENAYPTNESGFYAGLSIRPAEGWRLDAYADMYKFPWLKYLVDAPSNGRDFLAQLTFSPNKQVEIYTRFKNEAKQSNQSGNTTVTNYVVTLPRQNWRTQVSYSINRSITLRNRVELVWYDKAGVNKEIGFLSFMDIIYKPLLAPYSGNFRLQYFETGGYNSRIYVYENDVLYGYSIPAFFDKGFRYYLNLSYKLKKNLSVWVRLAQTIYPAKKQFGSGLDEIAGNKRTDVKMQACWAF